MKVNELSGEGPKVDFYARYTALGASTRQRIAQFLPGLQQAGFKTTVQSLLGDEHMDRLLRGKKANAATALSAYWRRLKFLWGAGGANLAVIHTELWPYLPALAERIIEVRYPKYVVDYDDAWFVFYRNRLFLRNKLDRLMARAAAVTVGSAYLAAYAKQFSRRVEIFPTTVDTDVYGLKKDIEDSGALVIGWMGSAATAPQLKRIERVFALLARERKFTLRCIGAGDKFSLSTNITWEKRVWSQQTEVAEIQRFDIGINPLEDDSFNRGKCGYKMVQYMACGVPVVASPVGANCDIVQNGIQGLHATTIEEWVEALRRLMDDRELRLRLGKAGRQQAVEKYSLQTVLPRMVSLYKELTRSIP
jgi:glycosyltransferase involved in cell wall biosynthesis